MVKPEIYITFKWLHSSQIVSVQGLIENVIVTNDVIIWIWFFFEKVYQQSENLLNDKDIQLGFLIFGIENNFPIVVTNFRDSFFHASS